MLKILCVKLNILDDTLSAMAHVINILNNEAPNKKTKTVRRKQVYSLIALLSLKQNILESCNTEHNK